MSLPPPQADQAYLDVSALEAGEMQMHLEIFVDGAEPGSTVTVPSMAFLLTHSKSGQRILFDLGCRRDIDSHPPLTRAFIARWTPYIVPQDVVESLAKGGIAPTDINTTIISHMHYDHIGDHTPFTTAQFIIGAGIRERLLVGYPKDERSIILADSVPPVPRTTFLSFDDAAPVGPFPRAHDLLGDGSLYIVDAHGHMAGHVNVLVRTSADGAWLFLAGDSAHHPGMLAGHKHMFYDAEGKGPVRCVHENREEALRHIVRMRELEREGGGRVKVLLAHDWEWYKENKETAFLPGKIKPLDA